jgi:CBS-domain-containing membrane protein
VHCLELRGMQAGRTERSRRAIGAIIGTELGAATGLFVVGGRPAAPLLVTLLGALLGAVAVTPALRLRERLFRRWLRNSLRATG